MGDLVMAAIAFALVATLIARILWPGYAAAEPEKTYTVAMLWTRLAIGALCTAAAACVTTIIARDKGRAAWWLGGFFLAVSLPDHFYHIGYVWADYPAWYHFIYLSYLAPIAGLTGRFVYGRSGHGMNRH